MPIFGQTTLNVGFALWLVVEILQFLGLIFLVLWVTIKASPIAAFERLSKLQAQVIDLSKDISSIVWRISGQEKELEGLKESVLGLKDLMNSRFDRMHG